MKSNENATQIIIFAIVIVLIILLVKKNQAESTSISGIIARMERTDAPIINQIIPAQKTPDDPPEVINSGGQITDTTDYSISASSDSGSSTPVTSSRPAVKEEIPTETEMCVMYTGESHNCSTPDLNYDYCWEYTYGTETVTIKLNNYNAKANNAKSNINQGYHGPVKIWIDCSGILYYKIGETDCLSCDINGCDGIRATDNPAEITLEIPPANSIPGYSIACWDYDNNFWAVITTTYEPWNRNIVFN